MKRVGGFKLVLVFLGVFLYVQCYAQNVGIGTELATHKLDVDGKVRMRAIGKLDIEARKIFVTSEGELVYKPKRKAEVDMYSSTFVTTSFITDGIAKYNKIEKIIFPLNISDSDVNTLDVEQGSVPYTLKIKKDGFYMYSGFFTFYLATKKYLTDSDNPLGFSMSIAVSKNNGSTWTDSFSGVVFMSETPDMEGSIFTVRLPPNVYNHKAGDLVRVELMRSVYRDGRRYGFDLKGTPLNAKDIEVTSRNGSIPYRLTITKK